MTCSQGIEVMMSSVPVGYSDQVMVISANGQPVEILNKDFSERSADIYSKASTVGHKHSDKTVHSFYLLFQHM